MLKKLTITNRDLVRNWAALRAKLKYGEADQLIIHENGDRYVVSIQKPAHRPGDIRPLLERLKKEGPRQRVSWKRPMLLWSDKNFKLMDKLWGKKRKK